MPLSDAAMIRRDLDCRGVRLTDAAVRAAVARAFEDDAIEGPASVARFGDARAIPELSRTLDACEPRGDDAVSDYLTVLGLGTAIQVLGGAPTESQRAKIGEWELRQRDEWPDGGRAMRAVLAEVAPLAEEDGRAAHASRTLH